jgi:hypothetical protein
MRLTPDFRSLSIEDRVQRQLEGRSSPAHRQVRQDKLLELLECQTRQYPLPLLSSLHFGRPNARILADSDRLMRIQPWRGLQTIYLVRETRNQSYDLTWQ